MANSLHDIVQNLLATTLTDTVTAIIYDDASTRKCFSYEALIKGISLLSTEIKLFCKEGDYIAVNADSTPELVIAFLSLVNVKAVACPLAFNKDFDNSWELCNKIGAKFIICQKYLVDEIQSLAKLVALKEIKIQSLKSIDLMIFEIGQWTGQNKSLCQELEFVVTSSGSTGPPKVIKVPGKCIIPNILSLCDIFNIKRKDVIFLSSPLTFDASIVQIFISLMSKATLLIVPDDLKMQPSKLSNLLFTRSKTTILQATPSLVYHIGESLLADQSTFADTSLRILCLGAEPFPQKSMMLKMIGIDRGIELYNIYGISEVSAWASIEKVSISSLYETTGITNGANIVAEIHDLNEDKVLIEEVMARSVSLGEPLNGTVIELRKENDVIEEGIGEIWIGGKDRVCLLNDETHITPYEMRPSGDIGLKKNGKIFFLGRKDNRVKIFGKFIDLGYIESIVEKLEAVRSCVCVCQMTKVGLNCSLVLYLSIHDVFTKYDVEKFVIKKFMRHFGAKSFLCDIVFLKEIPLNRHGKKDRIALQKAPNIGASNLSVSLNIENVLLDFFEEAINRGKIPDTRYDTDKTLVENGGDSFSAVFLENRVHGIIKGVSNGGIKIGSLYDKIMTKTFDDLYQFIREKISQSADRIDVSHDETDNHSKFIFQYGRTGADELKDVQGLVNNLHGRRMPSSSADGVISSIGARKRLPTSTAGECNVEKRHLSSIDKDNYVAMHSMSIVKDMGNKRNQYYLREREDGMSEYNGMGCYCSASRGNRFNICKNCLDNGAKSPCSCITNRFGYDNCRGHSKLRFVERWKCDTKKCIDASPLVVCCGNHSSSIVYIGSHSHYFYALNSHDGSIVWTTKLGDRVESSAAVSRCGAKIIVGCYDRCIYVLSRTNGTVIWKYATGESIKCSPVVNPINGYVYIGSYDHHLYALNIERMQQVWCIPCEGGSVYSSPALSQDSKKLFVGTLSGNVLALEANSGQKLWRFSTGKPIFSSILCYEDYTCFGCVDGKVYFLQQDGELLWTYETNGPIFSSCCFCDSAVMAEGKCILVGSHDFFLYCLKLDGNLVWKVRFDSPIYSTPSLAYFFKKDSCGRNGDDVSSAYTAACSTIGTIYIINVIDGSIVSTYRFPKETFSSPLVSNESIFVGCRDNNVYCLTFKF